MDGFLNENTISLQSYFVKWLCTHSFGSMTCSWKRILIFKSSNMMNWCSPSFLGGMFLSRHWCSTRDMRKNKETPCDLQCEWLYLNKVHICFCKLESQNNIHKCPGVTPDPLPSWLTILWKILRQKQGCRTSPDRMQNDHPSPPRKRKKLSFYIAKHIRI